MIKDKNKYSLKYLMLLSFILPIVILGFVYLIFGLAPFGEKSILASDMNNQGVDIMTAFRRYILERKNFLYSWEYGMGGNFLPIIGFQVGGPLSLLLLITPENYIQEMIFLIVLIKIGLSGLTFALFIEYKFKRRELSTVIFSCCYALITYNIIYNPLIMWLDGVIILPIVVIGIEKLFEKNNNTLLVISLTIIFISNFYTGYMVAIMSLIYYIYLCIIKWKYIEGKIIINKTIKLLTSYILAALLSSFMLLPIFKALKLGAATSNEYGLLPFLKYDILEIISKSFIGSYDTVKPGGIPNIYTSLFCVILILMYYLNKNINRRKKISSLIVFIIFFISISINTFYLVWHGFDQPDWFEGRFSFVICFFIAYIAYESFICIDNDNINKKITTISILLLILLSIINKVEMKSINNINLMVNTLFIISYLFIIIYIIYKYKNLNNRYCNRIFLVVILLELGLNSIIVLNQYENEESFENRKYFVDYRNNIKNTINTIKSKDNDLFYRVEKDFHRRENDSLGIGYKGISHFTSFYNKGVHDLLRNLGMPFADKVGKYEGSTLVTDSLLGVKYILSNNTNDSIYELISSNQNINIYKNPYEFGIGTVVKSSILKNYNYGNPFEIQNQILSNMLDKDNEYFKKMINVDKRLNNIKQENNNDEIIYSKINNNEEGYIEFYIPKNLDKLSYAYFSEIEGKFRITSDDLNISEYFGTMNKVIDLNNSDKNLNYITLKLVLDEDFIKIKDMIYSLDLNLYRESIQKIKNSKVEILSIDAGNLKFVGNSEEKGNIIFTTIPYDSGWSIKLNEKNVKYIKIFDAFIGIELPEKGEFIIEMNYTPPGLKTGILISLFSVIVVTIYSYLKRRYYMDKRI